MGCEICGSNRNLVDAIIERATVKVCDRCKHFGTVVVIESKKIESIKPKSNVLEEEQVTEYVVEDYDERIKKARGELGLTQEDAGKLLKEKASLISKLENGDLRPSLILAKKLEKYLNITLIKEYRESVAKIDFNKDSFTIGDLAKIKNKRKEYK